MTGVLHHFMVRRQTNAYAWVSLTCLSAGLLVFNFPTGGPRTIDSAAASVMAPVAGGTIAVFSAMASIASERLIKAGDFWQSQVCLYSWGVVLAIASYPVMYALGLVKERDSSSPTKTATSDSYGAAVGAAALIVLTASNGFLVAVMLKMKDNILKVVGTSASLVTIAITQFLLWPALRSTNFTPLKVCGSGIVVLSTWCYNFYNGKPWPTTAAPAGFQAVPEVDAEGYRESDEVRSEHDSDVDGRVASETAEMLPTAPTAEKRAVLEPTATKVLCCAMIVAFVTMEIALTSARATT